MGNIVWPQGKYRLTTKAYMPRAPGGPNEVLHPTECITYAGRPGPNMQPFDSAAQQGPGYC